MRCISYIVVVAVLGLVAGCTVERGTFDFPNPWFDLHAGPVTLVAFRSSTVLVVGGTCFTLALPFYAPIIPVLTLLAVLWLVMKWKAHDRAGDLDP